MLNKVQLIGNIAHNLEKQYINSNGRQRCLNIVLSNQYASADKH
ncbi:MAG: hypothetical protein AB3F67_1750 [Candidatus Phytoplasma solani]